MTITVPRYVPTFRQLMPSGRFHPTYHLTFPINPDGFTLEAGRTIEEVSIVGYRDIPRIGSRKLDRLSFTALLPGRYDASICNYGPVIPKSIDAANRLKRWSQGSTADPLYPLRVTIAGWFTDTMVLESVTTEIRGAEERGDIWVTVSLVQWFELKPKAWSYSRPARKPAYGGQAVRYVVQAGDTLWGIAKRHYGSGAEWRRIWERNKPMRSGNPNLIYPGEVILIPKK